MKVDYINPLLIASRKIIKILLNKDINLGKLSLNRNHDMKDTLAIIMWMTGDFHGRFIFSIDRKTACNISGKMMGENIIELDDVAKSAISELASMILGRTGIILSERGLNVQISYPNILDGDSIYISPLKSDKNKPSILRIPLEMTNNEVINLNIEQK